MMIVKNRMMVCVMYVESSVQQVGYDVFASLLVRIVYNAKRL